MIAYRAETALVIILRRHLAKENEARALIRELFISSAKLIPDENAKTLTVKIHRMANLMHDRAIAALLEELNQLNFCHPETGCRFIWSDAIKIANTKCDRIKMSEITTAPHLYSTLLCLESI